MPSADIISFLSLIVALSAYIAVIRLRIIDRIGDPAYATKKAAYKWAAKTLTLADAPLIISGALLFFMASGRNSFLALLPHGSCHAPSAFSPSLASSLSYTIFSLGIGALPHSDRNA